MAQTGPQLGVSGYQEQRLAETDLGTAPDTHHKAKIVVLSAIYWLGVVVVVLKETHVAAVKIKAPLLMRDKYLCCLSVLKAVGFPDV